MVVERCRSYRSHILGYIVPPAHKAQDSQTPLLSSMRFRDRISFGNWYTVKSLVLSKTEVLQMEWFHDFQPMSHRSDVRRSITECGKNSLCLMCISLQNVSVYTV